MRLGPWLSLQRPVRRSVSLVLSLLSPSLLTSFVLGLDELLNLYSKSEGALEALGRTYVRESHRLHARRISIAQVLVAVSKSEDPQEFGRYLASDEAFALAHQLCPDGVIRRLVPEEFLNTDCPTPNVFDEASRSPSAGPSGLRMEDRDSVPIVETLVGEGDDTPSVPAPTSS